MEEILSNEASLVRLDPFNSVSVSSTEYELMLACLIKSSNQRSFIEPKEIEADRIEAKNLPKGLDMKNEEEVRIECVYVDLKNNRIIFFGAFGYKYIRIIDLSTFELILDYKSRRCFPRFEREMQEQTLFSVVYNTKMKTYCCLAETVIYMYDENFDRSNYKLLEYKSFKHFLHYEDSNDNIFCDKL